MATDAKVKVKVELDSELQAAREALKKWKAKREKPRVCRGCKWLTDEGMCQILSVTGATMNHWNGEAIIECGKPHPDSKTEIDNPDDFGCNKWEAK